MTVRLTTKAACRVAGLDRDRFNEAVARGDYPCAPDTIPGRARLFDESALIGLRLFREFLDEGMSAKASGAMACEIARCASENPDARIITLVWTYFGSFHAYRAEDVPAPEDWDKVLLSGTDIRKAMPYRIGKLRELLAHYIEEERNIVGEDD